MVEGSRIDHALHNNDPVGAYNDAIEYDRTFKLVSDFVEKNPNTAVVSVADHETGGLTLGRPAPINLSQLLYVWFPDKLENISISGEKVYNLIKGGSPIKQTIAQYYGTTISDEAVNQIASNINQSTIATSLISKPISDLAFVNWANIGHTGVDVNVYSMGPLSDKLRGNIENTYICEQVASFLGLDMKQPVPE